MAQRYCEGRRALVSDAVHCEVQHLKTRRGSASQSSGLFSHGKQTGCQLSGAVGPNPVVSESQRVKSGAFTKQHRQGLSASIAAEVMRQIKRVESGMETQAGNEPSDAFGRNAVVVEN